MFRRNHAIAFADNSTTVSWIELIFESRREVLETQLSASFQPNPLKRSGVVATRCLASPRGYRRKCGTRQRAKFRRILHTPYFRSLSKVVVRPLLFRTSIDRPSFLSRSAAQIAESRLHNVVMFIVEIAYVFYKASNCDNSTKTQPFS